MAEAGSFARLLAVNPFFAPLGPETLEQVAALCTTRQLDAEEVLFLKGDAGDALYAVRSGQIRIATGSDSGKRLTLNLLGAGDVFGEIALLDGRPRTADAIAAEPSKLFVIRRSAFLALLHRQPALGIQLIELLCRRLRWVSTRMEEVTLMPLSARLARRLVGLTDDYGAELTVSQEELAVFAGATRESVNRQLQVWKRNGIIALGRAKLRVLDPEALARACRPEEA